MEATLIYGSLNKRERESFIRKAQDSGKISLNSLSFNLQNAFQEDLPIEIGDNSRLSFQINYDDVDATLYLSLLGKPVLGIKLACGERFEDLDPFIDIEVFYNRIHALSKELGLNQYLNPQESTLIIQYLPQRGRIEKHKRLISEHPDAGSIYKDRDGGEYAIYSFNLESDGGDEGKKSKFRSKFIPREEAKCKVYIVEIEESNTVWSFIWSALTSLHLIDFTSLAFGAKDLERKVKSEVYDFAKIKFTRSKANSSEGLVSNCYDFIKKVVGHGYYHILSRIEQEIYPKIEEVNEVKEIISGNLDHLKENQTLFEIEGTTDPLFSDLWSTDKSLRKSERMINHTRSRVRRSMDLIAKTLQLRTQRILLILTFVMAILTLFLVLDSVGVFT